MSIATVLALAVAGFIVFWVFIVFLISAMGGWRARAAQYRSDLPFTGRMWRWKSGMLGGIARYNGLTVGVNAAGLYLAVMAPLRPGHPPLFIPWGDIQVSSENRLLVSFIVFRFRRAPNASLWLRERFGREVLETARVPTTMHAP